LIDHIPTGNRPLQEKQIAGGTKGAYEYSQRLLTFQKMISDSTGSGFSADDIAVVRQNFFVMQSQAAISSLVFYRNLFTLDPSLRPLFHTNIETQGRKLMEALDFTVATLENPAGLVPVLESMGRRHLSYGTRNEHYVTVTAAMLKTLREILGSQFTLQAEAAWTAALTFITETMIRGADSVQSVTGEAVR
jgi:hemoglobin-like flavoprotein